MADGPSSFPTYDRLMWPTLQALMALGGSATNQEIDAKVIEFEALTDAQVNVLHGKGSLSEVGYRLYWSRTYLRAFGAIEQSAQAVWAITDLGRKLTRAEVSKIPGAVKAAYREKRRSQGVTADPETSESPELPPIAPDNSYPNPNWKESLLGTLRTIPSDAFERLSKRVLREAGFVQVQVTGQSGDGGIDGVGILQMALLSFPVIFQCKRYAGTVGPGDIRDFRGAMVGRADKGLFITTGTFTKDALREATRNGAPLIDLVDGYRLCDLLKTYELGVTTRMVEAVSFDPTWFSSI